MWLDAFTFNTADKCVEVRLFLSITGITLHRLCDFPVYLSTVISFHRELADICQAGPPAFQTRPSPLSLGHASHAHLKKDQRKLEMKDKISLISVKLHFILQWYKLFMNISVKDPETIWDNANANVSYSSLSSFCQGHTGLIITVVSSLDNKAAWKGSVVTSPCWEQMYPSSLATVLLKYLQNKATFHSPQPLGIINILLSLHLYPTSAQHLSRLSLVRAQLEVWDRPEGLLLALGFRQRVAKCCHVYWNH